jgi:hypothetical protein
VTLIHHPAGRHSLALQKAYTEGLRAVYLFTATLRDPTTCASSRRASATTRPSRYSQHASTKPPKWGGRGSNRDQRIMSPGSKLGRRTVL